jgi:hypothetical protein
MNWDRSRMWVARPVTLNGCPCEPLTHLGGEGANDVTISEDPTVILASPGKIVISATCKSSSVWLSPRASSSDADNVCLFRVSKYASVEPVYPVRRPRIFIMGRPVVAL